MAQSTHFYGVYGGQGFLDSTSDGNKAAGVKGIAQDLFYIIEHDENAFVRNSINENVTYKNYYDTVKTAITNMSSANGQGDTVITGTAGLHLKDYGNNAVRYYGAVGGDFSINTGISASNGVMLNVKLFTTTKLPLEAAQATNIVRNGNVINTIEGGSVIGGSGSSAAMAIGNINLNGQVGVHLSSGLGAAIFGGVIFPAKRQLRLMVMWLLLYPVTLI